MNKKSENDQIFTTRKIKVIKNGPYEVDGDIPLEREEIQADEEGTSCCWKKTDKVETKGDYTLCRCGKSKNKPFGDASHQSIKFVAKEK